jgi:hypothetical protein
VNAAPPRERADRQPVEAVRQVHRVGGGDQHHHDECDIADAQVGPQVLEERKREVRGVDGGFWWARLTTAKPTAIATSSSRPSCSAG